MHVIFYLRSIDISSNFLRVQVSFMPRTDSIQERRLFFDPSLELKRLCNRMLGDKSTKSQYNLLAFIASFHVKGSLMRIYYPKLPNMTHALSLGVFIAFKGNILQRIYSLNEISHLFFQAYGCSKTYKNAFKRNGSY